VVLLDHKALAGALTRVSDPRSDRQRRQLAFIAEFVSEIHHIAGKDNMVADTLSRPPSTIVTAATASSFASPSPSSASPSSPSMPSPSTSSYAAPSAMTVVPEPAAPSLPIDLGILGEAQESCPDCARAATSTALCAVRVEVQGHKVWVDTSSGVMQPLVPAALRRQVFAAVHSLAHPGIEALQRLIASRYLWMWPPGAVIVQHARRPR
jgi:hypothetical protein